MSDLHLISPYSNTTESFIKIMRIKEMITNLRSFDFLTNSPGQYPFVRVLSFSSWIGNFPSFFTNRFHTPGLL